MHSDDDKAGVLDGRAWPRIPDGDYCVQFVGHETAIAFKAPRVFLHFKVIDIGPYLGAVLYRAYRARTCGGKPRKGGAFTVGRNSDYLFEMATLLQPRGRTDRMSPVQLKGLVIRARVECVTVNHKQKPLPEAMQYSVVRELLRVEAGNHAPYSR